MGTRIERGHATLQAQLDDELGVREAWRFALLPLARLPEGVATSTALLHSIGGSILMLKRSLAAVVALVGVLAFVQLSDESLPVDREEVRLGGPEDSGPQIAAPEIAPSPGGPALLQGERTERVADPVESLPIDAPERLATSREIAVAGRIVDAAGAPLPDVTLRFVDRNAPRLVEGWLREAGTSVRVDAELRKAIREHPELLETLFQNSPDHAPLLAALEGRDPLSVALTSDATGRFEGVLPFEGHDVSTASKAQTLLGSGTLRQPDGSELRLYVVVPIAPIAGRVLDADGAPAEGVELTARMTLEGIHGFPHILDGSQDYRPSRISASAADGRFRHEALPVVPGLILGARTEQRGTAQILVDAQPREALELRLRVWRRDEPQVVTGRVLDLQGRSVPGARVLFSQEEGETDEDGRFELEVGYLVEDARLIVAKRGHAPAFLDGLEPRLREDPVAGRDLVLRIGEPTREIRGRVVDESGLPVTNARVYLEGGEAFGNVFANVEDVVGGRNNVGVETDASGRFVYDGLYRPSYGLRAFQAETFLAVRLEDVAAGTTGVELVLPSLDRLPQLSGKVVDRRGEGVPGATLQLGFTTYVDSRTGRHTTSQDLGVTDENGRFTFSDVPHAHLELIVRGGGAERTSFPFDATTPTGLELVVELRHRFQLERARFGVFDRFQAVDDAGEGVTVTEFRSGVTSFRDRVPLNDDPTWPTFEISDAAIELVFSKGGVETLRVPLSFERGAVTVVR